MNEKKLWFRRKTYGWGWTPVTWEGWAVTIVYLVLILACVSTLDGASTQKEIALMGLLPLVVLTVALIRICYVRGEEPRWQWGKRKD